MRRIDSCTDRSTGNLIATFLAVVILAQPAVADTLPYETRIATPAAQVRSGPGEKFYPTDTLAQGDTVEVYREETGGWLAIRPPKDSFSWISARDLKFRTGSLAEVAKDGVASRIGSRLSDQRNAAQVRLKKGEVVEIIGQQSAGWYKIAPPAGEFRWIHATNVAPGARQPIVPVAASSPTTVPAPQPPAEQPVVAASATNDTTSEEVSIPAETKPPVVESAAAPGDSWRASPEHSTDASPPEIAPLPLATPQSAPTPSPPPSPPPQSESDSLPPPPATQPAANSTTAPPTNETAASPPPAATPELARQLTDIELRLSRMAVAPPHLWNTELLERDAEQLLDQAQTTAERDAVKVTLAKIDQFTSLARQYKQAPPNTALSSTNAARYDAVGILRPVVSQRPGAPQFAVVDEQGQVVSFVTPSPDVNLQAFVGTRVGITGNRGFIPEFNRAHVTAGRITPLSDRMLR